MPTGDSQNAQNMISEHTLKEEYEKCNINFFGPGQIETKPPFFQEAVNQRLFNRFVPKIFVPPSAGSCGALRALAPFVLRTPYYHENKYKYAKAAW